MKYSFLRGHLKKQKGFTFIEVLAAAMLLGLLVLVVQSATSNLLVLKRISEQDTEVYQTTKNIFTHIRSGRSFTKYLLNASEQNILKQKGINVQNLKDVMDNLKELRFSPHEKKIVFDKKIKSDGRIYQLKISRDIIEPEPFLFGIKVEVVSDQGKSAMLSGIISFYDFIAD